MTEGDPLPPRERLENKSVIICCGSGGVGKTSVSSAVALQAAINGRRSIVITIDPARRLASSLGVEDISDRPRDITSEFQAQLDTSIPGSISALMLDSKGLFDRTVMENAPDDESVKRILDNRLYQIVSAQYAGTQEFMAVQQLMEIADSGEYDLIVLDTPPTRHALDFLDAPNKLIHFLDERVLNWFAKPIEFLRRDRDSSSPKGFTDRIVSTGSSIAFGVFEKLTSKDFVEEFGVFIHSFYVLRKKIHDTAERTEAMLKRSDVSFLLVCSPSASSLKEAKWFRERIMGKDHPFFGFIVNRIIPDFPPPPALSRTSPFLKRLKSASTILRTLRQSQLVNIENLSGFTRNGDFLAIVPESETDIHDAKSLRWLAESIFEEKTS